LLSIDIVDLLPDYAVDHKLSNANFTFFLAMTEFA